MKWLVASITILLLQSVTPVSVLICDQGRESNTISASAASFYNRVGSEGGLTHKELHHPPIDGWCNFVFNVY